MFDQVKVNQNSILNLLKVPERESYDNITKSAGTDFFSMIMEKTGFEDIKIRDDNKFSRISEPRNDNEKSESAKTVQNEIQTDNSRVNSRRDREGNNPAEDKSKTEKLNESTIKNEKINDSLNNDIKKVNESTAKEAKVKKSSVKNSDDETDLLNQLHGGINIKNLMEIIKASFSGNKKAEEENFRKLFSNLKLKQDKDKGQPVSSSGKNETDRNQKNSTDLMNRFTKDIKEIISMEILKSLDNRKKGGKAQIINDKDLKDIASNIIDNIKKNKAKDTVRHEVKNVSADETKIDKKPLVSAEQQVVKKSDIQDNTSSDKNGTKDKNQGKDNFSYNGAKIDFSAKSGLEKIEHSMKMPDFKENFQEIIDKAKVTVRDSRNGTFTMKLNPQELGNINVNLIMENGVINGKFLVDNEDAKSLLLNNLDDLKNQLEQAGIAVGEFSVNVNDQRDKYLKQKGDDFLKTLSSANSNGKIIAAAEQYDSGAAANTGHINLVI